MKASSRFVLVSALIILSILSCDKDDDPSSSSVVGTWTEVKYEFIECPNPDDNFVDECSADCITSEFKSDGSYSRFFSNGTLLFSSSYYTSGSKIFFGPNGELENSFTVSGDVLTITEVPEVEECKTRYRLQKN
jgi:hypothetical protein